MHVVEEQEEGHEARLGHDNQVSLVTEDRVQDGLVDRAICRPRPRTLALLVWRFESGKQLLEPARRWEGVPAANMWHKWRGKRRACSRAAPSRVKTLRVHARGIWNGGRACAAHHKDQREEHLEPKG